MISVIGKTITLADTNPRKINGLYKFFPWLQQILDDLWKKNPPTMKKLPVEVDV